MNSTAAFDSDFVKSHSLPQRTIPGMLSIVIPCHNEEPVIETTHRRLSQILRDIQMDYEILYIDDGSRDLTLAKLLQVAANDRHVQVVELARNFGQQAAMSAGLECAKGDAVVLIDADLQDPPEVIPEMVQSWRNGVDVAYGRRRSREGETWFKLVTASLFHRLLASLVPHPVPIDTGDFKLLDRSVVDAVCATPEKRRYLRSLVAWTGFRHEAVWYDRQARSAGITKYSIRKLIALAGDALIISSDAPIRLTWIIAGVLACCGIACGFSAWLFWSTESAPLVATIAAIVMAAGSLQTVAVAIVGEYVVRAYREAQGRPTSIIKRVVSGGTAAQRSATHILANPLENKAVGENEKKPSTPTARAA
ncbi:MAG: glycosyltransferase [Planctomycetaceae bacterium]|nr:MAG: glycosyltransferase [Planctomycetaceae bacterium]